jgi:Fe-S-cluster containining protein
LSKALRIHYDCELCPAYCCSYARIHVGDKDVRRLARHFGLTEKKARRRFTRKDSEEEGKRVLRHQLDEHYGTACTFLDSETRQCTVYDARPAICREFPGTTHCGYYDFLSFERDVLEDEDYVSTTWNDPDG